MGIELTNNATTAPSRDAFLIHHTVNRCQIKKVKNVYPNKTRWYFFPALFSANVFSRIKSGMNAINKKATIPFGNQPNEKIRADNMARKKYRIRCTLISLYRINLYQVMLQ